MKRFISTICVVSTLVLSASALSPQSNLSENDFFAPDVAYTAEQIETSLATNPDAVEQNEYDGILQAKSEAKSLLKKSNINSAVRQKAEAILEFNPTDKVYEYQKKTDEELESLGLDNERITIIRGFSGTESELRALSATVTGAITNVKYSKSGSTN